MKKYSLALVLFLFFPIAAMAFPDVPSSHPNYDAIKYLEQQGTVGGYSDGTFKPDNKIDRAAFTKIAMLTFIDKSEIFGENCFSDVKDEWYAEFVCTAKRKNIIGGFPDGTFQPEKNISFDATAKILSLANNDHITEDQETWYRPYVNNLANKKAIPISIKSFDQEITRGEMAEMVYRIKANINNKKSLSFEEIENENNDDLIGEDVTYETENINQEIQAMKTFNNTSDSTNYKTFDYPLENYKKIQNFNVYNNYYKGYHTGEDCCDKSSGLNCKTKGSNDVYAIANGNVVYTTNWNFNGGFIIILHDVSYDTESFPAGKYYALYGHLERPSILVKNGQTVKKGQKIAKSGFYKGSYYEGKKPSNYHMHFEIRTFKYYSDKKSSKCGSASNVKPGSGYCKGDKNSKLKQSVLDTGYVNPSKFIEEHKCGPNKFYSNGECRNLPSSTSQNPSANTTLKIRMKNRDYCVTATSDKKNVVMKKCGSANQEWYYDSNNRLKLKGTDLCMSKYSSTTKPNQVILRECVINNAQKWYFSDQSMMRNYGDSNNLCLDGTRAADNANVYMGLCHFGDNQKFEYISDNNPVEEIPNETEDEFVEEENEEITYCTNGTDNPPDCDHCQFPNEIYQPYTDSCALMSCNNKATNPPECDECDLGYEFKYNECVKIQEAELICSGGCPDICDGNTKKYNGVCNNGNCNYQTEYCQHGCTNGECQELSCSSGQHPENGDCVPNIKDCPIENGTGEIIWSSESWGECKVKSCNTNYVQRGDFLCAEEEIEPAPVNISTNNPNIGKSFAIRIKDRDYCIQAMGRTANSAIQMQKCNASNENQIWEYASNGAVKLKGTELCMDQKSASYGRDVHLYTCAYGENQKWKFLSDNSVQLLNAVQTHCLDGSRAADGANVYLFDCSGGAPQKFEFDYITQNKAVAF